MSLHAVRNASRSKGGLIREPRLFFGHTDVFRFFLLARDFALGRFPLVQPDGLRIRGSRKGVEPLRGHDDPKP